MVGWQGLVGHWESLCARGHLSIVEMLLHHDQDVLEMANQIEETPLLLAMEYRQSEIVHFLLDRGANALVTNHYGMTTLLLACREAKGGPGYCTAAAWPLEFRWTHVTVCKILHCITLQNEAA